MNDSIPGPDGGQADPDRTESALEPSPRAFHESRPLDPERIGPYRILERIGEGGFGAVYADKDWIDTEDPDEANEQ